jgi:hypothetical protein
MDGNEDGDEDDDVDGNVGKEGNDNEDVAAFAAANTFDANVGEDTDGDGEGAVATVIEGDEEEGEDAPTTDVTVVVVGDGMGFGFDTIEAAFDGLTSSNNNAVPSVVAYVPTKGDSSNHTNGRPLDRSYDAPHAHR